MREGADRTDYPAEMLARVTSKRHRKHPSLLLTTFDFLFKLLCKKSHTQPLLAQPPMKSSEPPLVALLILQPGDDYVFGDQQHS